MPENFDPIIDNVLVHQDTGQPSGLIKVEQGEIAKSMVLFSSLPADPTPIVPFTLGVFGVEYPRFPSSRCAICNSPNRELLEFVYLDSGKKINTVVVFFEKHFNAKLNWEQVNQHIKRHCDLTQVQTPGLKRYEGREAEINRWKYREHELALTAVLVEIDEVSGLSAKTADEVCRRAALIDKLTTKLLTIKQLRDENTLGLPNVFEVLAELHESITDVDSRRIIREKVNYLHEAIAS